MPGSRIDNFLEITCMIPLKYQILNNCKYYLWLKVKAKLCQTWVQSEVEGHPSVKYANFSCCLELRGTFQKDKT